MGKTGITPLLEHALQGHYHVFLFSPSHSLNYFTANIYKLNLTLLETCICIHQYNETRQAYLLRLNVTCIVCLYSVCNQNESVDTCRASLCIFLKIGGLLKGWKIYEEEMMEDCFRGEGIISHPFMVH